MIIEAWIVMDKTLLDSLWPTAKGDNPSGTLYLLTNGVRGHWKGVGADEVVNVIGSREQIDAFLAIYGASISAVYEWVQGPGVANRGPGTNMTVPQGVLDVMKDHVEYDGNGNVIGTTPATLANPNWGHVFLGQGERVFSGEYSNDFSEDFL